MTWALVTGQTGTMSNGSTQHPTVAVPNTIGSGNLYCGAVAYTLGATLSTVTDDKSNTYNLKSTTTDTVDGVAVTQFELGNVTNAPKTITINFTGATDSCAVVAEFSGALAASDPNDGTVGNYQPGASGAANVQTSTAITTTLDGDLIVGAGCDGASTSASTVGTSPNAFTSIGTASNATAIFSLRLEYFVQTTHGSIAATFTSPVNGDNLFSNVVAFKPASTASILLGDYTLDAGLAGLDAACDKIFICGAMPTSYADATSGANSLGNYNFGAGNAFTSDSSYASGMQISSVAITSGSVTANGTVAAWAAVDSANSRLLASGSLTGGAAVTAGQFFSLSSFTIQMPHNLT